MSRQGRELQKFHQRSFMANLSDLCSAIKKMLGKILGHRHLNSSTFDVIMVYCS